MNLKNKLAVLTGAGSGIGRATALSLAQRGCHLALADISQAGLTSTIDACRALGVKVSEHCFDVTDRAAVAALPAAVAAAHQQPHESPHVDLLINNAGVALGGTFEQVSESDFDWLMEINFHAVVRMTRAFLPALHNAETARIVNISSAYGLISPPGQSAYSAAKFAVRGFSNSLRHELAGSTIGVMVVHPGGVATAIARNARVGANASPEEVRQGKARAEKMLKMPPEQAGEIIVRGIEAGRERLLVGNDAKIVSLLERLAPVHYWRVLARLLPA